MSNNRWSTFPQDIAPQPEKQPKEKKKILTLKVKSFLLILVNVFLILFYLYTHRDLNLVERAIYGLANVEMSILFEMLAVSIFVILTFLGIIIWSYFFIKEAIFPAEKKKEKYFLRSWYETKLDIDTVVIIALLIRLIIQPFSVFGSSMEPNFHNHQYIIINAISYRLHSPARGDIIVFKYPYNKNKNYIKRIIGLPKERIQIKNNQVYIYNSEHPDGFVLNENYLIKGTKTTPHNKEFSDITLKDNEYYVLGDNRESSSDSRDWGPLPKDLIIGKTWILCWPLSDWKIVPSVQY